MFRTDVPTAVGTLPTPAAPGTPGFFSNGNPALGIPSTIVDQDWANRMQEEVMSVLTSAGITPVKSNYSQLLAGILAAGILNDVSPAVNVLVANPTIPFVGLVIGTQGVIVPAFTNTGPSTLNVSSSGALAVLRPDGTVVQPGDLPAGRRLPIIYDGTAWRLVNWPTRVRLAQNLTLFCNAQTGSDNNTGLTLGTAFQTLSGVYNYIYQNYDVTGFVVTVQCSGNFTNSLNAQNVIVGATVPSSIVFNFAAGSTVAVTNDSAFKAFNPGVGYIISGTTASAVTVSATGSGVNQGYGVLAANDAQIFYSGVNFGACATGHNFVSGFGIINKSGPYTISGNAPAHDQNNGGEILYAATTVTLTGTPAFSTAFINAFSSGAQVNVAGVTFTGSATGTRFNVTLNASLFTNGSQALVSTAYIPGNANGVATNGGVFA
jgi:hypothetical protein